MVESTEQEQKAAAYKEAKSKFKSCLSDVSSKNDDKKAAEGLALLNRLVSNVVDKPTEMKFRKINAENAKIKSTVMCLEGISELILALGFTKNEENNFEFAGEDFKLISFGKDTIAKEVEVLNMDPEARKKHELI